jgi:hypothetical protein
MDSMGPCARIQRGCGLGSRSDIGIKGNSHMIMMDKNSDAVAGLIQKWLVDKGLGE